MGTPTSPTITATPLTAGLTYKFKIKAVNKYGEATNYSNEVSFVAGQKPDPVNAPTITQNGVYVHIEWDPATDNYLPITKYEVQIETLTVN